MRIQGEGGLEIVAANSCSKDEKSISRDGGARIWEEKRRREEAER